MAETPTINVNVKVDNLKPGRLHPGVGVGAIVVNQGHLLMVQRAGAHGAGTWSVPGGWVEQWENPWATAEREVEEETGLKVASLKAEGWTDSQHHAEGVHAITLWVRCAYVNGDPRVVEPEKCPVVEWVPFRKVETLDLFHPLDDYWDSLLPKLRADG